MNPRRLVIDASAVVEVLRATERATTVTTALKDSVLAAPAHLDAEVLSALGRLQRAGAVEASAVDRALALFVRMPIERYPIAHLLQRTWALRDNIALRDGLYVACAQALNATLLTLDARLARSSPVPVQVP